MRIDALPSQTPVSHWPEHSGPAGTVRDDMREAVNRAVKGQPEE